MEEMPKQSASRYKVFVNGTPDLSQLSDEDTNKLVSVLEIIISDYYVKKRGKSKKAEILKQFD